MKDPKSLIKNIIYLLQLLFTGFFFFFFFFPEKLNIRFDDISAGNIYDPLPVRIAKVVIWFLVIYNLIFLYYIYAVKRKRSELASGISLSVLTVVIVLIFFEIGFMFFPQTHGIATTRASILWVDKYYKPVNSLGYRDREPDLNTRKKVILFVGDSFTAGYGNKYVKERFSEIVYSRLDTAVYDVYNLGIPGMDTRGEAGKLREYPLKPDVIVLAYFFNDIEVAAADHGYQAKIPPMYSGIPQPLKSLVIRLYFPNFIYWHLPNNSHQILDQFVRKCYGDPHILQTHLNDLADIIRYKEENQAEMITVMIPYLPDLDYSARFTTPVSDYLEQNGVTVVTIEEEVSKLSLRERVVNNMDSHASFKVNEIIAQKLLKVIQ